jgi:SAM-dependent MidA family methyltransferase
MSGNEDGHGTPEGPEPEGAEVDSGFVTEPAEQPGSNPLPDGLAEALDHLGSLRWDQYMELALYAPASGFFATQGRAGRRGGDFITSPEVGPTFGALLAQHLDELWDRLGRPTPFTVLEGGAGRGALAIAVRASGPQCASALHWVMVERSATLRSLHGEHLELVDHRAVTVGDANEQTAAVPDTGPWFSSLAEMPELPDGPLTGAVVANELLDNLPFRLLERSDGRWQEVMVTLATGPEGAGIDAGPRAVLVEELAAVPEIVSAAFDEVVPDADDGTRAPWQPAATKWVTDAIELLEQGEVIVFDYADPTASLAARPQHEWLRTYRSHERGLHPLQAPGSQDITVEVAIDQLPPPDEITTQADWLRANGLDDLVADADRRWQERAGIGDLEAIRARSVATEAAALVDPAGLGAFKVLTWRVDGG